MPPPNTRFPCTGGEDRLFWFVHVCVCVLVSRKHFCGLGGKALATCSIPCRFGKEHRGKLHGNGLLRYFPLRRAPTRTNTATAVYKLSFRNNMYIMGQWKFGVQVI